MIHDEFPGKLNASIPRNQNHMLAGKKMTGNPGNRIAQAAGTWELNF